MTERKASRRQVLKGGASRALGLASLAVVVPACSLFRSGLQLEAPLEVVRVVPVLDADAPSIRLTMSIRNPRKQAVQVTLLDWALWLDGHYFAAGSQAVEANVGPDERKLVDFDLPLTVRFTTLNAPRSVKVAIRGSLVLEGDGVDKRERFEGKLTEEGVRVPSFDSLDD